MTGEEFHEFIAEFEEAMLQKMAKRIAELNLDSYSAMKNTSLLYHAIALMAYTRILTIHDVSRQEAMVESVNMLNRTIEEFTKVIGKHRKGDPSQN